MNQSNVQKQEIDSNNQITMDNRNLDQLQNIVDNTSEFNIIDQQISAFTPTQFDSNGNLQDKPFSNSSDQTLIPVEEESNIRINNQQNAIRKNVEYSQESNIIQTLIPSEEESNIKMKEIHKELHQQPLVTIGINDTLGNPDQQQNQQQQQQQLSDYIQIKDQLIQNSEILINERQLNQTNIQIDQNYDIIGIQTDESIKQNAVNNNQLQLIEISQQNNNEKEKIINKLNSKAKPFIPKKNSNKSEINQQIQQTQHSTYDSQKKQSLLPINDQTQQQNSSSFQSSSSFPIMQYQTKFNSLPQTPLIQNQLNFNPSILNLNLNQYQQFNPFPQLFIQPAQIQQNNIISNQFNLNIQQQYPIQQNSIFQQQQIQQQMQPYNINMNNQSLYQQQNLNQNLQNKNNHTYQIPTIFGSKMSGGMFGIQDAPKYQLDQLHQIMKDIHSIIESNTINDEVKEIKLQEIYYELKKKEIDELKKIFNIEAFKLIQTYINDCITGIEKILLDMIELVAEKGQQEDYNQFFDSFQQSGIINKIQQLIKDKIKIEKEQKKYSEETEQLSRINIQLMKERESDQSMIDIYTKVIEKNLIDLLNIINKLKLNNNEAINNQMNKEEIESELKQSAKLIRVISQIREKNPKYDWIGRIPELIIKILKQKVSPMIHLNCPEYINCNKLIIIQASPALQELKEAIFQALVEVYNNNSEFVGMLIQDNNFLPHLAQFIISYSTQFQLEQKTNINQQQHQQQSEYSSSPTFISSSLQILYDKIRNNYIQNSKQIIQIPNFLRSLTILINYKCNIHINNEQDQQSQQIRKWSRQCLNQIQSYGDEQDQSELTNVGYGRALIIYISTAGGTEEQRDWEIFNGLNNISRFICQLRNGRNNDNDNNQPSFPTQPALSKRCIEQIEEEGGNEEIESQLINKWNEKDYYNNIKYQAYQAIIKITKIQI